MSIILPVEHQFHAYNAHDLAAFLRCFSENFVSYRMPDTQAAVVGKAQLATFYAEHRFNNPNLRAELLSRTLCGNKVFDHELIYGLAEKPIENMAVFQVGNGLIEIAWFYTAS